MIISSILEHISLSRGRGIVFAAGGSADIVLAKNIAARLISEGCLSVDLAQPLNCKNLSEKGLLLENAERYFLEPEDGLDPESILRHYASVPSDHHPSDRRGKGLNISSSLEWEHGTRYVCAAHGRGLSSLAGRRDGEGTYYSFAVGVDGGGDVLTHDDEEFDRKVIRAFRSEWSAGCPLLLISMGLGADGGSAPGDFDDAVPSGWKALFSVSVDGEFARALQCDLEKLGLWHPAPSTWNKDDPYWGYGLKVPQIIALAVRGEFPFDDLESDTQLVRFPRRRELKLMDRRLLREARIFLSEGEL